MAKIEKTHAMRVLDAADVAYEALQYDDSGAFHSAEEAAALTGAPPDAVYKTLVIIREGAPRARPLMVMIPGASQVNLKLLARETGDKKLRMATQREAEQLTGMQAGGISALGLRSTSRKPAFEVLIDERARQLERIHISAGVRGVEISLHVDDLVRLTGARYVRAADDDTA